MTHIPSSARQGKSDRASDTVIVRPYVSKHTAPPLVLRFFDPIQALLARRRANAAFEILFRIARRTEPSPNENPSERRRLSPTQLFP